MTEPTPLPDNVVLYPYTFTRDEETLQQMDDFLAEFDQLKVGDRIKGNNFLGFLRDSAVRNLQMKLPHATKISGMMLSSNQYTTLRNLFPRFGAPVPISCGGVGFPREASAVKDQARDDQVFLTVVDLHRDDGLGGILVGACDGNHEDGEVEHFLLAQWADKKENLIGDISQIEKVLVDTRGDELKEIADKKRRVNGWFALFFFCLAFFCTCLVSYIRDFDMISVPQAYLGHAVIWGIWLGNGLCPYLWDVFGFSVEVREYKTYLRENKL